MEKTDLLKLGENIKKHREKSGISQMKFAELMGLHLNTISLMERGKTNIPVLQLLKISKILNCKVTALFKGLD
jgi:transcriptional regulator with XRE-family HTH domain